MLPGSGLSKRSFWKTVFLSPAENRWFWRKMGKFWYYILTSKRRDFAPQTPENNENGECHPGKMTVCQKHHFDNLDRCVSRTERPLHDTVIRRSDKKVSDAYESGEDCLDCGNGATAVPIILASVVAVIFVIFATLMINKAYSLEHTRTSVPWDRCN